MVCCRCSAVAVQLQYNRQTQTMTSETDYRGKMRAVFLAAIMVISMVGMSVAFTGAAAAQTTETTFDPSFPYQGQDVTAINDSEDFSSGEYELRRVDDFDSTGVEESTFVTELTDVENPESGTDSNLTIDTADLDADDYFVRGGDLPRNPPEDQTFEVRVQDLDAEFDDDEVTDSGEDSVTDLDIDSNRGTYSVNVSADGDLDEGELLDVAIPNDAIVAIHQTDEVRENVSFDGADRVTFNDRLFQDAAADGEIAQAINESLNNDDNFDGDFRKAVNETVDDNTITTYDEGNDVFVVESQEDFQDFLFGVNQFKAFSYAEDLDDADEQITFVRITDREHEVDFAGIDADDYTFDFDVSDTEASASADITVREEDIDGSFTEGVYQEAAGDVVEFEIELEDTDDAWVQIGDEDAGYLDVVYVVDDDETGDVQFQMNTRLAGTSASTGEVYNSEDDVIEGSAVHDMPYGDVSANFLDDDDEGLDSGIEDDGSSEADFNAYLDELDLIDTDDGEDRQDQLTRPMQPTDYELTASEDGVFIADDGESEADEELDSSLLELEAPEIGDITTHVAPSEDADEDDNLDDLLDVVTEREEIALEDRLIVQVEATGLYGAMVDRSDEGFDLFEDGTTIDTIGAVNDIDGEGIEFEVEAEERTGNQDPTALRLDRDNEDEAFVVFDDENDQFFVIVNTDEDAAWSDGEPRDGQTFTASLSYDTDDDDRYAFDQRTGASGPFSGGADGQAAQDDAYPYFQADSDASSSAEFTFESPEISFNNLNADDEVQAENVEDSEISGTTNVAPGSSAELRVSSTDASSSFRIGQSVDIDEDGDVSAEYDFSGQEVGDEFDTRFRVSGSNVDTVDSVIVAEGDLGVEDPVEDDEDDVVDDDDDVVDDDDDDVVDDDDDVEEPTDDETPGFGALVALVALIGAALLAVRRQNN